MWVTAVAEAGCFAVALEILRFSAAVGRAVQLFTTPNCNYFTSFVQNNKKEAKHEQLCKKTHKVSFENVIRLLYGR